MSATARHDVHACPDCRLTFPSRRALHRHGALDHRPAADGAWLTARIIDASHTCDEPDEGVAGGGGGGVSALVADRSTRTSTPAGRPVATPERARVPWLLVWAISGLAVLTVPTGVLLAFSPLVLAWALHLRRQLRGAAVTCSTTAVPQRRELNRSHPSSHRGRHHTGEVMIWIALIVLVALAAGVLGTLLEIALWAIALTVLVVVVGGFLLSRAVGSGRSRPSSS